MPVQRWSVGVAVAGVLTVVGCSGEPDTTSVTTTFTDAVTTTTTAQPFDDDALVPIAPVTPTTTTPSTTTTTLVVIEFPAAEWPAVTPPSAAGVRPAALTLLTDDPGQPNYDVAPDGLHLVRLDGAGEVCIASVADGDDIVCAEGKGGRFAAWSTDADRVVFGESSWVLGSSGPLGTLSTAGDISILVETADPDSPIGGALAATFLGPDTVAYTQIVDDFHAFEVRIVSTGGSSDDQLAGSLVIEAQFWPITALLGGDDVYMNPNIGPTVTGPVDGIWRYQPRTGTIGPIRPAQPGVPDTSTVPIAARGGVLLTADGPRLQRYTSHRSDAAFFELSLIDGSQSITVDDLDDDHMIIGAGLSPDGAQLAVYEVDRSGDPAAERPESGRVSIATTADLFAGTPDWATIEGLGSDLPSGDLDGYFTTISWPTPERLYVELVDALWAVDVAPA